MADEEAGKRSASNQSEPNEGQEEVRLGNILASKLLKKKTAEPPQNKPEKSDNDLNAHNQADIGADDGYEPLEYDLSGGLLTEETIDFENSPLSFSHSPEETVDGEPETYDLELPEEIEYGHFGSEEQSEASSGFETPEYQAEDFQAEEYQAEEYQSGEYQPVAQDDVQQEYVQQEYVQQDKYAEPAETYEHSQQYEQSDYQQEEYAQQEEPTYEPGHDLEPVTPQYEEPAASSDFAVQAGEGSPDAGAPSAPLTPETSEPAQDESSKAPASGLGRSKLMQKARHSPEVGEETGRFMLSKFVAKKDAAASTEAPAAAGTQQDTAEVEKIIAEADEAFAQHKYLAAEPLYARAITSLDQKGDDTNPVLLACLEKAADNGFELGKYKDALPHYRRLLVLKEKVGAADGEIISVMYKIALACEKLSLNNEADSMYKRAFRLGQQSLVPGDPLLAKVLEGYGNMLVRMEGGSGQPAASRTEAAGEPSPDVSEPPQDQPRADTQRPRQGVSLGSTASAAAAAAPPPAETSTQKKEASAAQRPSSLSAEEIALLNQLGVKKDEPAPAPKEEAEEEQEKPARPPIAKPPPLAGPRATFAHLDAVKPAKPLFAKHEQLLIQDEVPPEPPEPPKPKVERPPLDVKQVSILAGICVGICILLFGTINYYQFDFSESKPRQIDYLYPPRYTSRMYKTIDGTQQLGFNSETEASKTLPSKEKRAYKYKAWKGTPMDDIELITGAISNRDFVVDISRGLRESDGVIFFTLDCPESLVGQKMKDVLTSAQAYYRAHKAYPKDATELATIDIPYINPVSRINESVPVTVATWPGDYKAADTSQKSSLETSLEDGGTVPNEPAAKPAQISAISTAGDNGQMFIIHGRDRDGNLLHRSDGKVWILVGKNGVDATPSTTGSSPESATGQLRVTKLPKVELLSIFLSYVIIFAFGAASFIFGIEVMNLRANGEKKIGFTHLKFGWALAITVCAVLLKLAPDPLGGLYVFVINALLSVGFFAVLFRLLINPPRLTKKTPDQEEATATS